MALRYLACKPQRSQALAGLPQDLLGLGRVTRHQGELPRQPPMPSRMELAGPVVGHADRLSPSGCVDRSTTQTPAGLHRFLIVSTSAQRVVVAPGW